MDPAYIYSVKIDTKISPSAWQTLSDSLPEPFRSRNQRFHYYEDRQRHLFGLLLLKKCLSDHFTPLDFNDLEYDQNRRPYLKSSPMDFNISHSGQFVVCAVSEKMRVGIDVEFRKEVDLSDFQQTMSQSQWEMIHAAADPLDRFFWYWTVKESVIKADGRGLQIPLTEITILNDTVRYDGLKWYLNTFKLDQLHPCCLATDQKIDLPSSQELTWEQLR